MDRAKAFYGEQVGFHVDVDHRGGGTSASSAYSTGLGVLDHVDAKPRGGRVPPGMQLVVQDIEAARADLASRSVEISEPFHFGPEGQTPGLDPDRRNHGSFASFNDPDGNGWMLQEVKR